MTQGIVLAHALIRHLRQQLVILRGSTAGQARRCRGRSPHIRHGYRPNGRSRWRTARRRRLESDLRQKRRDNEQMGLAGLAAPVMDKAGARHIFEHVKNASSLARRSTCLRASGDVLRRTDLLRPPRGQRMTRRPRQVRAADAAHPRCACASRALPLADEIVKPAPTVSWSKLFNAAQAKHQQRFRHRTSHQCRKFACTGISASAIDLGAIGQENLH